MYILNWQVLFIQENVHLKPCHHNHILFYFRQREARQKRKLNQPNQDELLDIGNQTHLGFVKTDTK